MTSRWGNASKHLSHCPRSLFGLSRLTVCVRAATRISAIRLPHLPPYVRYALACRFRDKFFIDSQRQAEAYRTFTSDGVFIQW